MQESLVLLGRLPQTAAVVRRRQATERKVAGKVRVDGYAGGKEPGKHGVYHYHVDTQDGLNALFMELKAVCGQQCEVQTRPGRSPPS